MEIRILEEHEIPQALALAQGVYDFCLSGSVPDPQLTRGFKEYSSATISIIINLFLNSFCKTLHSFSTASEHSVGP